MGLSREALESNAPYAGVEINIIGRRRR